MSSRFEATHYFFQALTLAAVYPRARPGQGARGRVRAQPGAHTRKLKLWAENCPENYLNCYALVSAEVARVEGRDIEAMRLYEQSIEASAGNGFVHWQAWPTSWPHALPGARLRAHRRHLPARGPGATRAGSRRQGPSDRSGPSPASAAPRRQASTTLSVEAEQIDVLSVVKATQTISGELVLDQLLRTLLEVVLGRGRRRCT